MLRSTLAITIGAIMLMPFTAFAAESEPALVSTQQVVLTPSGTMTSIIHSN